MFDVNSKLVYWQRSRLVFRKSSIRISAGISAILNFFVVSKFSVQKPGECLDYDTTIFLYLLSNISPTLYNLRYWRHSKVTHYLKLENQNMHILLRKARRNKIFGGREVAWHFDYVQKHGRRKHGTGGLASWEAEKRRDNIRVHLVIIHCEDMKWVELARTIQKRNFISAKFKPVCLFHRTIS
jgi:hypothetical protein